MSVSVAEPEVFVRAGEKLSVKCNATGTPTPSISWQKDGSNVISNTRANIRSDGTLQISELERDDVGSYACTATSGSNTDSQQIQVSLLGKSLVFVR